MGAVEGERCSCPEECCSKRNAKSFKNRGEGAFLGDGDILGFIFAVDGDYVWCRWPGYLRELSRPVSSFLGFYYFFGWKAFTAF
jgi:hypothetical protein